MKINKSNHVLVIIISLILLLAGCRASGGESQRPAPATLAPGLPPIDTALPPTSPPAPTLTSTPSPTETPTITPTFSPQTLVFLPGEPLRIGYLLWETNPIGLDSKRGIEIAIQDFGGELFGHSIELVGYDDECNELAGQRGAQLLALDDTVVGILGTTCSSSALRAVPIVSDAGKIILSPSTTNPDFTAADSHSPGFFRTAPNDISQVNAVAQYAIAQLGRQRIASIYTANSKTQQASSDRLCQAVTGLGGECVLQRAIESGTTYLDPAINAILASGADVVHLMLGNPKDAAAIISQLKQTPGLENIAIFVWEALNSPEFLSQAGEDAVGVFAATTAYDFDHGTEAYQTFLAAYREKYGLDPPSDFHAFGYDAASLLLRAIATVSVQDPDGTLRVDPLAVRDALYRRSGLPGLTGLLSCSPLGDCAGIVGGRIYQFTNGDPGTFKPGPASSLSSNPSQVWP